MNDEISVEELNRQRDADPAFQARRRALLEEREWRREQIARMSAPIIQELGKAGVRTPSLVGLFKATPLDPVAADVLLKWVTAELDPAIVRDILHLLRETRERFDGSPLVTLFEKSEPLRAATADTISAALPAGVTDWAVETLKNPAYGEGRIYLAGAVANLAPPEVAVPALQAVFRHDPEGVAKALAECGDASVIGFLERELPTARGSRAQAIEKAIRRIAKRTSSA